MNFHFYRALRSIPSEKEKSMSEWIALLGSHVGDAFLFFNTTDCGGRPDSYYTNDETECIEY